MCLSAPPGTISHNHNVFMASAVAATLFEQWRPLVWAEQTDAAVQGQGSLAEAALSWMMTAMMAM